MGVIYAFRGLSNQLDYVIHLLDHLDYSQRPSDHFDYQQKIPHYLLYGWLT